MTRYRLNSPPVISETVDGEVIIINLDNGKYSSIRANSATVWLAVVAGNTADAILAECQGASDTADANLSAFIDTLRSESLIVETEATTATSPPQAWADERLTVETFEDMTDLLGLDPVHEVDLERGWPVASN